MNIKDLPILKSDERGIIYDCDKVKLIVRKKGSVGANHIHDEGEILYLIDGEVELTIGDETEKVKSPVKIEIPSNVYHKLITLTDIKLLEIRI